ncbi:MAG: hypothetical protein WC716_06530 [Chitinophagaceae bacterium]|jgi:hypothetical protein
MKNFIFGLIVGVVIAGAGAYLSYPKYKQASYDEGFAAGNKEGITKGTAIGMEEGIAKGEAQQKAVLNSVSDSMNNVLAQKQEALAKASRKPVIKEKLNQNWRVLGGNIAEPIPEGTVDVPVPPPTPDTQEQK